MGGLGPREEMKPGDTLMSSNGRYQLILQTDGNLVIYDLQENHLAIWSSRTNGQAVSKALMQDDGNFVVYGFPAMHALWATNTAGQPGAFLILQDDGNLAVYRQIQEALWSAGTQGQ